MLTESRVRRFHVRFAGATPTPDDLAGATVVAHTDGAISFEVTGSVDRVVKTLARFEVTDLTVDEPSLEDAFLRYYDQDAAT